MSDATGGDFSAALRSGDTAALDSIAAGRPDLPANPDHMLFAVACCPATSVAWMIAHDAPVRIDAEDGFPLLHLCIDRLRESSASGIPADAHAVMRMLLEAGADANERGVNDWTPLHRAAIGGDETMMAILIDGGADHEARTGIDHYATPEEEARQLGRLPAADFIRDYLQAHRKAR